MGSTTVFANILTTIRRVLAENLRNCTSLEEFRSEITARTDELDVLIEAYSDAVSEEKNYKDFSDLVQQLRLIADGMSIPVYVDVQNDTVPVVTPPPPEAAYNVTKNIKRGRLPQFSRSDVSFAGDGSRSEESNGIVTKYRADSNF